MTYHTIGVGVDDYHTIQPLPIPPGVTKIRFQVRVDRDADILLSNDEALEGAAYEICKSDDTGNDGFVLT